MTVDGIAHTDESGREMYAIKPIGEVAEIVGLTPRAIRYYEELGLLRPAVRVKGVPRLYNQSDIQRLREIKRLREIAGFSLADLSELLENEDTRAQLRDRFRNTDERDERVAVLARAEELAKRRLAIIEGKLRQLESVRAAELEHIELIRTLLCEQETEETAEGRNQHATED